MSKENKRYTENGYKDRRDYLDSLSENYDGNLVSMLSEVLGEEEDFDGLVTALEDFDTMY